MHLGLALEVPLRLPQAVAPLLPLSSKPLLDLMLPRSLAPTASPRPRLARSSPSACWAIASSLFVVQTYVPSCALEPSLVLGRCRSPSTGHLS
eukprot:2883190-Pyramimonas_sp.AAC.1